MRVDVILDGGDQPFTVFRDSELWRYFRPTDGTWVPFSKGPRPVAWF